MITEGRVDSGSPRNEHCVSRIELELGVLYSEVRIRKAMRIEREEAFEVDRALETLSGHQQSLQGFSP